MSLLILKSSWFNLIHRRLRSQMCEMACKLFFQVKKPSSLEQGLVLLPAVSTGIQWLMESGASLTYQHVRWTYKLGQDHAKPANSNNCSHFLTEFKWITMNQAYSPKALRMHHAPSRMTAIYLVIAVVVLAQISGQHMPIQHDSAKWIMCSLKMFKGVNTPLEAHLVACWIRNSRRTAKHSSDSYQAQVLYRRFGLEFMPVGQAGLFMYRCLSPREFVCRGCVWECVLRVACWVCLCY